MLSEDCVERYIKGCDERIKGGAEGGAEGGAKG